MIEALHHAAALVLAGVCVLVLGHTGLFLRAPRTAVLLWQVTGLTAVLAVLGLLLGIGLGGYHLGVLPSVAAFCSDLFTGHLPAHVTPPRLLAACAGVALALWLLGAQLHWSVRTARSRKRHRELLRLVARTEGTALVLDHPAAAAYCLPGPKSRVVISAGTLRLLTPAQLAAVLSHEHAHARARHHLVLAPFTALHRALPENQLARRALAAVELLIELCADDHAARRHGRETLADALERFAAAGPRAPAGTLAAADSHVRLRIDRLRQPPASPRLLLRAVVLVVSLTALATPASLFALPV
ncbi:M56 family metallopeptidase [Amycolatopsis suaedae]|uniref:M56 family peptidase n=1 Tax=Amycolatopsis suaedae TaxID=2510978 RepID=A0A4Q7J2L8_9PSEU|nr:M56 family metallopeptidase [Amycolatopsis suaedae]RZQ61701.1 M56 family peptidase [Amycolatopsis suaedae]